MDEKGRPIAGVSVDFASGRDVFSDGSFVETDAQGRFAFDSLPPDTPFGFSKEGFSQIQGRRLELDGEQEVVVEMTPAGVLVGKAIDAKTGKPIRNFLIQVTFSPRRRPEEPSSGLRSDINNPGQTFQSAEGRFKIDNLVGGHALAGHGLGRGVREAGERAHGGCEAVRSPGGGVEAGADRPGELAEGPRPDGGCRSEADRRGAAPLDRGRAAQGRRSPRLPVQLDHDLDRADRPGFAGESLPPGHHRRQGGSSSSIACPKGWRWNWSGGARGIAPGRLDHVEAYDRKDDDLIELVVPSPSRVAGTIDRKLHEKAGRIGISSHDGAIVFDDQELKPGQSEYEFADLPPGTYTVTLTTAFERIPNSNGVHDPPQPRVREGNRRGRRDRPGGFQGLTDAITCSRRRSRNPRGHHGDSARACRRDHRSSAPSELHCQPLDSGRLRLVAFT